MRALTLRLPRLPARKGRGERRLSTRGGLLRFVLALSFAIALMFSGLSQPFEERLQHERDAWFPRKATRGLVVIEIDSRSLSNVGAWPWPRSLHGKLVDRLHEAGAATIGFDIDFSAHSTPREDQAFAAALGRAGGSVILPTFRQDESYDSKTEGENLPIEVLRDHAFLASVNVRTDEDGLVRRYPYGLTTGGVPRPSMSAMLAGVNGTIDSDFAIDTTIDPATVPRLSAIDVINGKFDPADVAGRAVLIGATAIEMGDRYVVPGLGMIPGVVMQAVAAETLVQKTAIRTFGPVIPLAVVAIVGLLMSFRGRRMRPRLLTGTAIAGAFVPIIFEFSGVGSFAVVPTIAFLLAMALLDWAAGLSGKVSESQLYDPITGLPNGRAFAQRYAGYPAVQVIDMRIRQFEEINAALDAEGLALLCDQVARRLELAFPSAELHAIEAGVLAWGVEPMSPEGLTEQLAAAAALFVVPIQLEKRALLVTPAFGVAVGPGADARDVLAQAGLAARQALARGARWVIHSEGAASQNDRALSLLADVDSALAHGQLYVRYQPKLAIAEDTICGAEALVRWEHPHYGNVPPDEFIPLLEEAGRAAALTAFVLDSAIAQRQQWKTAGADLTVAVNISAALLEDSAFVDAVLARLRTLGSEASRLTFEVTESATIARAETAIGALNAFRRLGARVSIDDYGTGNATLTYLKAFPADEIKIDKSFVTNLETSASDQILVRSTIEMAGELGFAVVAEGIETEGCLAKLREFGCAVGQGWVIGKPLEPAALLALALTRNDQAQAA